MENNEQNTADLKGSVERLSAAAEALDAAITRLTQHVDAQQSELGTKVDRIVAVIDESAATREHLEARIADLEHANSDLSAQLAQATERAGRKTLPPIATALLAKSGVESVAAIDPATLDQTLAGLSVEQRIAVKAEMARAGIIG